MGVEEKGRMGGSEYGQNTRCTCMDMFHESITTDAKWASHQDSGGRVIHASKLKPFMSISHGHSCLISCTTAVLTFLSLLLQSPKPCLHLSHCVYRNRNSFKRVPRITNLQPLGSVALLWTEMENAGRRVSSKWMCWVYWGRNPTGIVFDWRWRVYEQIVMVIIEADLAFGYLWTSVKNWRWQCHCQSQFTEQGWGGSGWVLRWSMEMGL